MRDVVLRKVKAYSTRLDGAIVENVLVERITAGKSPIFLRGNAYRHVTLRGRIGRTEIRGKMFPPISAPQEEQESIKADWDAANLKYYETVDWALDISEAEFTSFSVCGIPSRLIRRDPTSSAVVTREAALRGAWRKLAWNQGTFFYTISRLAEDGYEDGVLVACSRSKNFEDQLEDLQMLRDEGIAT